MNPVRVRVELPVRMAIGLLQAVVGAHTQVERYKIALRSHVREMIICRWESYRVAIDSKQSSCRGVVSRAHLLEQGRISGRNFAELRMSILSWIRNAGDSQIPYHPSFVPSAFVVDYKQA